MLGCVWGLQGASANIGGDRRGRNRAGYFYPGLAPSPGAPLTPQLPYHHATYWPALKAACKTRREAHLETWRSLGPPAVGREERLWKVLRREVGGDEGGMGVAVQVEAREAGGEEKLSKEEVGEEKEDEGVIGAGAGAGAGVVGA